MQTLIAIALLSAWPTLPPERSGWPDLPSVALPAPQETAPLPGAASPATPLSSISVDVSAVVVPKPASVQEAAPVMPQDKAKPPAKPPAAPAATSPCAGGKCQTGTPQYQQPRWFRWR